MAIKLLSSRIAAVGVEGFGQEGSNACLFVGSDGERGVLAQKDMKKGTVVVQVPFIILLLWACLKCRYDAVRQQRTL